MAQREAYFNNQQCVFRPKEGFTEQYAAGMAINPGEDYYSLYMWRTWWHGIIPLPPRFEVGFNDREDEVPEEDQKLLLELFLKTIAEGKFTGKERYKAFRKKVFIRQLMLGALIILAIVLLLLGIFFL